ncbi:uncharacterized protein LOC130748233 [Lotus japonicus]|uniref:uncharacterized protein LOC130748233 n=1 Tax=Lotus japonicus TaxID=34305 RepID=UPI0025860F11|nr:uncharacterized protein LOC130748233 [Lotus japonicus]
MQNRIKLMLLSMEVALVISLLLSLSNQQDETDSICSGFPFLVNVATTTKPFSFNQSVEFTTVRSAVIRIHCHHRDASPAVLRRHVCHDCFNKTWFNKVLSMFKLVLGFNKGYYASPVLADGDRNRSIEKQAIRNGTMKQACGSSGTMSCADVLAATESVFLAGGRDSNESLQSFNEEATDENPRSDDMDNITCTLHLYNLRTINERHTMALLDFSKTGCDFIQEEPYSSLIAIDLVREMRPNCTHNMKNNNTCSDKVAAPLVISNDFVIAVLYAFAIALLYDLQN